MSCWSFVPESIGLSDLSKAVYLFFMQVSVEKITTTNNRLYKRVTRTRPKLFSLLIVISLLSLKNVFVILSEENKELKM